MDSIPGMGPLDVNQGGYTTSLYAPLVVNWLNQPLQGSAPARLDTNADGLATPSVRLPSVNKLNEETIAEGESAFPLPALDARVVDSLFGEREEGWKYVLGSDLWSIV